mmetsp:Transcript_10605/g.33725  ORF Transcript_10605/g.33725 Transcript_10605/m.33725 type:complete len:407 (-) Transcript_10605:65-1285(-)
MEQVVGAAHHVLSERARSGPGSRRMRAQPLRNREMQRRSKKRRRWHRGGDRTASSARMGKNPPSGVSSGDSVHAGRRPSTSPKGRGRRCRWVDRQGLVAPHPPSRHPAIPLSRWSSAGRRTGTGTGTGASVQLQAAPHLFALFADGAAHDGHQRAVCELKGDTLRSRIRLGLALPFGRYGATQLLSRTAELWRGRLLKNNSLLPPAAARLVEDAEEGQRSMRRPHPVRRRVLHSRLCIRLLHDDARNWDVHAQLLAARAEVGRETAGAEDNVLSLCTRLATELPSPAATLGAKGLVLGGDVDRAHGRRGRLRRRAAARVGPRLSIHPGWLQRDMSGQHNRRGARELHRGANAMGLCLLHQVGTRHRLVQRGAAAAAPPPPPVDPAPVDPAAAADGLAAPCLKCRRA